MNKQTGISIGVVVLLVIAGGVYASVNNKKNMAEEKTMMEDKAMQDKGMEEKNTMMETGEEKMMDDKEMSVSEGMMQGSYEAYASEKLARATTGDVVLFFHASWCPSCRGLNADIEANLSSIPKGVTILKVDYDKETELKKKYGVTYQHTLVQVDASGNMIQKWSGSPKLSSLVGKIQ